MIIIFFNFIKLVHITGPPQIISDSQVTSHLVVDKDETAVVIVQFCADPKPRKTFWEWDAFRLETGSSSARHTADVIHKVG